MNDHSDQAAQQKITDWVKDRLANPRLSTRIMTAAPTALLLFSAITTAAYFFLPTGLLHKSNPLQNWDTSSNLVLSTLQIFSFNMLSVLVILFGNLFAQKSTRRQKYPFPFGLTAFFVLISVNALVLGTWSFAIVQPSVDLGQRIVRMFDLAHRAGLWEMTGQMLIACATVGLARIITVDGHTSVQPWNAIQLSRTEWWTVLLGLVLMACGAFIESAAILSVV